MDNLIPANFSPEFRKHVAQSIKYYGVKRVFSGLLNDGHHPAFAGAIVRSIIRREGW